MPILHLLRHGTLLPNPERRFVGQRDIPLSEEGRRQAHLRRKELFALPLKEVWTSDLSRCREMTAIILNGKSVPVHAEPAFREIHLGRWEGLTKAEVETEFPGAVKERGKDFWNVAPQGGESFAMLARRVLPALLCRLRTLKSDEQALLVAHSGVNRIVLMQYMALNMQDLFSIPQSYAACTTLRYGPEEMDELESFCLRLFAKS